MYFTLQSLNLMKENFPIKKIEVEEMKKIKSELKFCIYCMEEHEVDIVEMKDTEIFKDEEVNFKGTYQYCPIEDELLETEEIMRSNDLAMKDAYRKKMNLIHLKKS